MIWPSLRPSAARIPASPARGADLDTACGQDIWQKCGGGLLHQFVKVPRDRVVAFALCTHDHGVLKNMSAQVFPLREDEPRQVRLELKTGDQWRQVAFLGRWSEDWTGAVVKAVLSQTAICRSRLTPSATSPHPWPSS
ncbi:MAG: hypothetical protein ACYC6Y_01385 [Thermoguttaceae bacterium]